MQLLESSPEEDNSCPQVPQGPSTSRAWRGPGRAGCVLPGKEKPGEEEQRPGKHGRGCLFICLDIPACGCPCTGRQAGWDGSSCRDGFVLQGWPCPAGMGIPCSMGSAPSIAAPKPRALFPPAFHLSPGVGRLAQDWFGFGVFWGFLGFVCAF